MSYRFLKWFFAPSSKPIIEELDLYTKIAELENRISTLENENIETTNTLYEIMNSIDAVDVRIDILTAEKWTKDDV